MCNYGSLVRSVHLWSKCMAVSTVKQVEDTQNVVGVLFVLYNFRVKRGKNGNTRRSGVSDNFDQLNELVTVMAYRH